MDHAILDRGRGPEIAGSRITVYDVLAETQAGTTPEELAQWYQLDVAQIQLALRYIEEHREEVLAVNRKILDRIARGNPPEVEAKRQASHAKLLALKEALAWKRAQETNGEGNPG